MEKRNDFLGKGKNTGSSISHLSFQKALIAKGIWTFVGGIVTLLGLDFAYAYYDMRSKTRAIRRKIEEGPVIKVPPEEECLERPQEQEQIERILSPPSISLASSISINFEQKEYKNIT